MNGVDVRVMKQKSLRERIGVVPQATTLFNDTLGSNIAYGKKDASEAEIEEALKAAQLTNFVDSLPGKSSIRALILSASHIFLISALHSQRDWTRWLEIVA